MNKYRFFYLIWILPAYMFFLIIQQGLVYKGSIDTYENGTTIMADVTDFDVKQIAAQSNGYIEIRFATEDSIIERRLSLSIQMAQALMESPTVPIKYQEGAIQEIVLFPTFEIQKSTSLVNMAVAGIAFGVTFFVAFLMQRYANRKFKYGDENSFEIERVD